MMANAAASNLRQQRRPGVATGPCALLEVGWPGRAPLSPRCPAKTVKVNRSLDDEDSKRAVDKKDENAGANTQQSATGLSGKIWASPHCSKSFDDAT
jgi:hypothetical protein